MSPVIVTSSNNMSPNSMQKIHEQQNENHQVHNCSPTVEQLDKDILGKEKGNMSTINNISTPSTKGQLGVHNDLVNITTETEENMRTPAPIASADGLRAPSTLCNHVTPLDNNMTNKSSVTSQITNSIVTASNTNSQTVHPVSRRGGRFVSPGQRQAETNSTTNMDQENITSPAVGTSKHVKSDDSNSSSVLEYKTFRSPSRVKEERASDPSEELSDFPNRIDAINNATQETTTNNNFHSRSIYGSLKIEETKSNDRTQLRSISSVPSEKEEKRGHISGTIRNVEEATRSNNQDKSQTGELILIPVKCEEVSTNDEMPAPSSKVNDSHASVAIKREDGEEKKTSKEVYNNIPCRSPTRDSIFTMDDAKSPEGVFWLSPGPRTPKSPSKSEVNGREHYMATPTDFLLEKDSNKHNKFNHTSSNIDKCPDTAASFDTTSSVLAWLQSPTGLFSPGGFVSSLNNTPIRKTPRTPIVSTSFFFSDVASLPRHATNHNTAAVDSTPNKCSVSSYNNDSSKNDRKHDNNNNVICVSPMLVNSNETRNRETSGLNHHDDDNNNSLTSTPAAITGSTPMMDFKNVFASPHDNSSTSKTIRSLPLLMNDDDDHHTDDDDHNDNATDTRKRGRRRFSNHHHHLPPRVLSQRSSSSSKLDENEGVDSVNRHLAERDLMEDEALSILIRLASNNNPNTPRSSSSIFRSSPMTRESTSNTIRHNEGVDVSSRLQMPLAANMSQRRLSISNSASSTSAHDKQDDHHNLDFAPPPILGMRSNSLSTGSKEIYVGSKQRQSSAATQEASEGGNAKPSEGKDASGKRNTTGEGSTSTNSSTTSSTSYPMHCLYSVAMGYHGVPPQYGPHPPTTMSGNMSIGIGGSQTQASASTSTGGPSNLPMNSASGQYGEYPAIQSFAPYGQYPPPPHHHMVGGYTPYPPNHYQAPPHTSHNVGAGHMPLEGATPTKNVTKSNNSPSTAGGRNSKSDTKDKASKKKILSSNNKRGSPSAIDSKTGSSKKKKTAARSPVATKGVNEGVNRYLDSNTTASASKKTKNKSPAVPADYQKTAANIAAVNTASGGKNDAAAALAAAILRGVTMRPSGKWQAQLYFAGKSRYIGVFDSREKAALAYEIAREKLKNGENSIIGENKNATTENLVNAARKAAFDGVSGSA